MTTRDVVRSLYPLTFRLLGKSSVVLVDDYLHKYPPQSFQLEQVGRRFCEYLTKYSAKFLEQFPHLFELAHLEWAQIEVVQMKVDQQPADYVSPRTTKELNNFGPLPNATLSLRSYSFPMPSIVHRLKHGIGLPDKIRPATTHLVLYRDPATKRCEMLELSGVVARLVTKAVEAPLSYTRLIEMTAPLCRQPDTVDAIVSILELIDKLQSVHIFVGSIPVAETSRAL